MKKNILAITFVLLHVFIFGQTPSIQWQKTLGGSSNDNYAARIKATADGGYIVIGETTSNDIDVSGNHGDFDIWVVKMDSIGDIEWQKTLGGSGKEIAHSIIQTSDGGYLITGGTFSNDGDVSGNHGGSDVFIAKLYPNGTIEWKKVYGGSLDDIAVVAKQASVGGYIIVSTSASNNGNVSGNQGLYDYWIIKIDNSGNIEWQKTYGGSENDLGYDVFETNDGGFIALGSSHSNNGDASLNKGGLDYWILKLDNLGTIQWQKSYGGNNDDELFSILKTDDFGYILAGYSRSITGDVTGLHGLNDYWIVKIDTLGNLLWQKCFGGNSSDRCFSIVATSDQGFILGGTSGSAGSGDVSFNYGGSDFWLLKIDSIGTLVWEKNFGGTGIDLGYSVDLTHDGGYIVSGSSTSNNIDVSVNYGLTDFWIVKLNTFTSLNVDEFKPSVKNNIFPNPSNGKFQFAGIEKGSVIKIFDIYGKLILYTVFSEDYLNVNLDVSKGIYIYQIEHRATFLKGKIIIN